MIESRPKPQPHAITVPEAAGAVVSQPNSGSPTLYNKTSQGFLSLAEGVFYRSDAGGGIFLNTVTNKLLSVDKVGDLITSLCLEGRNPEIIKDALARQYPAKETQISVDVDAFIQELVSNRLLIDSASPSPLPGSGIISRIACFLVETCLSLTALCSMRAATAKLYLRLMVLHLCIRSGSFWLITRIVTDYPASDSSDHASASTVANALSRVCRYYPTQVLCLQRSAVLTLCLRDCSFPASLVMGAMKYPLKAHAWVEINGELIDEISSLQKSLVEIARI